MLSPCESCTHSSNLVRTAAGVGDIVDLLKNLNHQIWDDTVRIEHVPSRVATADRVSGVMNIGTLIANTLDNALTEADTASCADSPSFCPKIEAIERGLAAITEESVVIQTIDLGQDD